MVVNSKLYHPGHNTLNICLYRTDTKLLEVGFHPYYLPSEFSSLACYEFIFHLLLLHALRVM